MIVGNEFITTTTKLPLARAWVQIFRSMLFLFREGDCPQLGQDCSTLAWLAVGEAGVRADRTVRHSAGWRSSTTKIGISTKIGITTKVGIVWPHRVKPSEPFFVVTGFKVVQNREKSELLQSSHRRFCSVGVAFRIRAIESL